MNLLMLRIAAILLPIVGAVSSNPGAGAEGAPTVPTIPNSIGDTDGEMANGQKNGDDTVFFGKLYGKGKYTFPNGDEYDGEWLFFMRHGTGTLTSKGKFYRYQGGWSYGKKHGKGAEAYFWNFIEFEVEYDDGQQVHVATRRYPWLFRFAATDTDADIAGLILDVIIWRVLYLFQPHFILVYVLVYFWVEWWVSRRVGSGRCESDSV